LFNNKKWELRTELEKYALQDVKSLHQVISKFSEDIYKLVKNDVVSVPTLSLLAFKIYRSKFMVEENIPIVTGNFMIS
jgi:hypothetical protein